MITIRQLFEIKKSKILYHASPIQNLKILKAKYSYTSHKALEKGVVYATSNKSLCSGFSFKWDDSFVSFGWDNVEKLFELSINKKDLSLLEKPCSIYTVDKHTFKIARTFLEEEYISYDDVEVLTEEKYKTARDCMKIHGVKINLI